jgi:hypothetical protein
MFQNIQSIHRFIRVFFSTKVVSSDRADDEVYSIQYDVIKFVNDLWEFGDFLRVPRFPPPWPPRIIM